MSTFVVSDTHFGHRDILTWLGADGQLIRGQHWQTVEQMNEAIVANWNSVVKLNDTVYHLGDVFFGSKSSFLELWRQLNGRKHLVLGNHDCAKFFIKHDLVKSVQLFHRDRKRGVILSHMPLHSGFTYSLHNVHGHLHHLPSPSLKHTCVSLEQASYSPVDLDQLLTLLASASA
jgi:calcineurin-like phosphoesterase family protein